MQNSRISILFKGYLDNKLSKSEIMELQKLLKDEAVEHLPLQDLIEQEMFDQNIIPSAVDNNKQEEWLSELESKVLSSIKQERRHKIHQINKRWLSIAASIVLIVSLVMTIQYLRLHHFSETDISEIAAGGNKAYLVLENGERVKLKEDQSEIILGQSIRYTDGKEVLDKEKYERQQFYEIAVPRGGTYTVLLPDSSKVWLNADSRLICRFGGKDQHREVELQGEGYFEVTQRYVHYRDSKQRLPFTVKSGNQIVKVLGTAFNISAYGLEPIKTTLLHGSVEVTIPNNAKKQLLKPNQQMTNRNGEVDLKVVDPTYFTAWKDGVFNLSDAALQDIMNQVSRWYDIDVTYEQENLKKLKFEGIIPRYENLKGFLSILEKAGDVAFERRGNMITVKRKNIN